MRLGVFAQAVFLRAYGVAASPFLPVSAKRAVELSYWQNRRAREGTLRNDWYESGFTKAFGLGCEFFARKRILDIGCGPRGSLEWATMASERVGLDPLAASYRRLGGREHAMRYVAARSEEIPFEDGYFDIVASFNSLDHVDDLEQTIGEMERVTAHTLLLVTDVNHSPTRAEPQVFGWDIVERFRSMRPIDIRHYEKHEGGTYASLERAKPYDTSESRPRYGVLLARLEKVKVPSDAARSAAA